MSKKKFENWQEQERKRNANIKNLEYEIKQQEVKDKRDSEKRAILKKKAIVKEFKMQTEKIRVKHQEEDEMYANWIKKNPSE